MFSDGEAFKIVTQSAHAMTRTELKIKERLLFVNVVRKYLKLKYIISLTAKALGKYSSL